MWMNCGRFVCLEVGNWWPCPKKSRAFGVLQYVVAIAKSGRHVTRLTLVLACALGSRHTIYPQQQWKLGMETLFRDAVLRCPAVTMMDKSSKAALGTEDRMRIS